MKFRKLEQWEHGRTKTLYETVFSEDKGAFADYYYTWKTKDNTIYVAEDENGIYAMVHLNPFEVNVYGKVQVLHYIVAVATEEKYRHRGLMRNLLNLAMREMAENGEPFTFLMPASEAIYLPFGFQFVSWQRQGILKAEPEQNLNHRNGEEKQKDEAEIAGENGEICAECRLVCHGEYPRNQRGLAARGIRTECRPVCPEEYQTLADMANETLAEQADIFIWRNRAYYERLLQEQSCQGGDVMVVLADGKIVGTFCTAREESEENYAFELREIIAIKEFQDLVFVALQSFADENGDCKVYGCPDGLLLVQEERVPLLMARQLSRPFSVTDAAPDESVEKKFAAIKTAELTGAVIFINEVV